MYRTILLALDLTDGIKGINEIKNCTTYSTFRVDWTWLLDQSMWFNEVQTAGVIVARTWPVPFITNFVYVEK